jgi:hypothetical protein
MDTSSDTFDNFKVRIRLLTDSIKAHAKTNSIELNTDYFPCKLKNAKSDNPLLKKYAETHQPKYLFEAIERDITVLQDPIVLQTIINQ